MVTEVTMPVRKSMPLIAPNPDLLLDPAFMARLDQLATFGLPLLVGASRKRFIDKVSPAPPDRRLGGSLAAHLIAVAGGARIVRAHDVAETVQALKVAAAIRDAR